MLNRPTFGGHINNGRGEEKAVCRVARLAKILTTERLLRYLASPSALHPIFFFIPSSQRFNFRRSASLDGLMKSSPFIWI